jgi:site-specific recombinase XerD
MQVADPLFHIATTRRPGRPFGSKSRVVLDPRALGIHHFAFVRSSLLGLDLRDAFTRYLAWSETTTDLRYVQNRRDALLQQIIESGRNLDPDIPKHAGLLNSLELLRSQAKVPAIVQLPSLEEWVEREGMDPDMYGEAELLAEYKAAFGLDNADALEAGADHKDPTADRVRALNHLEVLLAVNPSADDKLEAWFARSVVKRLRNVGLLTLRDLVNFINVYGYRWHGRIKSFGTHRAQQVVFWLRLQQEQLNLLISNSVSEPKSRLLLKRAGQGDLVASRMLGWSQPGIVPTKPSVFGLGTSAQLGLDRMRYAPGLSGDAGTFRSHMANTLGANNDLDAVNSWLERYQEKPATQRSYRKEVERFMLWCAQELKKPLSSVTSPDCQRYRDFLKNVPLSWIHPAPVVRTDPQWRAFRGQPNPASQKQALVILQTLFTGLVDAGYLVANPMRSLMKSFDLPASKMDIRRSFTEKEWNFILQGVDALEEGPERVRLKCILELLVTSGVRLDELAKARHRNLRLESLPDLPETWILTVTGKRNKTRDIPLNPDVVHLLAMHGKEFIDQDKQQTDSADLPVIRTLHASVPQWESSQGGKLQTTPMSEQSGTPLSAAGIYAVLKRFFGRLAKTAAEVGLDPLRFEKASTHWMRHTFVRQALVDGVPIEVVSDLAGHASIDTTSIYATQELARKIKAVQGMKRRVAA